jgi:hypothetical protein
MTKKQTPAENQPNTTTEGAEAPFLIYACGDEKVHVRVLIHSDIKYVLEQARSRVRSAVNTAQIGRFSTRCVENLHEVVA